MSGTSRLSILVSVLLAACSVRAPRDLEAEVHRRGASAVFQSLTVKGWGDFLEGVEAANPASLRAAGLLVSQTDGSYGLEFYDALFMGLAHDPETILRMSGDLERDRTREPFSLGFVCSGLLTGQDIIDPRSPSQVASLVAERRASVSALRAPELSEKQKVCLEELLTVGSP